MHYLNKSNKIKVVYSITSIQHIFRTSYELCFFLASCDDGIQNQGEEGIDCGGPACADCRKDLKIFVKMRHLVLSISSIFLYS